MKKTTDVKSTALFAFSMFIFGTIGVFRRYIPLPSAFLAFIRGVIGCAFLVLFVLLIKRDKFSGKAIKNNLALLLVSGGLIGFNWIFLFEAYEYTTVAVATLCYYMAPTFVIFASPFVLKEKLTVKRVIFALISVAGMVLVSGAGSPDAAAGGISGIKGILFGLAAAVLYATVILLNKKLKDINAYDKTTVQLGSAAIVVLPYVLLTTNFADMQVDALAVVMILVVGIIHTGICYALYFGSMKSLKAQTIAMFSYIDPVIALLLSHFLLKEEMGIAGAIGAVLILGSAFLGEII